MSLKQQHSIQAGFSMASMTDIIFLLLVFFMATSTFVFPTALEVDLPQSVQQTSVKPKACVFIDAQQQITAAYDYDDFRQFAAADSLAPYLMGHLQADTTQTAVAIYADHTVPYGKIVEVLNVGAKNGIKMVLATQAEQ